MKKSEIIKSITAPNTVGEIKILGVTFKFHSTGYTGGTIILNGTKAGNRSSTLFLEFKEKHVRVWDYVDDAYPAASAIDTATLYLESLIPYKNVSLLWSRGVIN